VKPAHGRKHASQRVALLSTIQTDGMIFHLQPCRLFDRGRRGFAEDDVIAKI
jgi:hypothetical protein